MRVHIVKQGESIVTIARRHGFADPMTIYDDPANAEIRKLRPNPNLLFPGDKISIPDRKTKSIVCQTNQPNVFQVTLPRKTLRLVLQDSERRPMANVGYKLIVGDREYAGTTGEDGLVQATVDARATAALLGLNGAPPRPIGIDHLNPMANTADQAVSGVQARLRNLGYAEVPVDGVLGPLTRAAIGEYQAKHGLPVTGELSDPFVRKLEQEHGC